VVYRGHVKDGKVEMDSGCPLPEGAEVDVTLRTEPATVPEPQAGPTLFDQLAEIIGSVPGLPEDLSINHDHYLYGTAKRE